MAAAAPVALAAATTANNGVNVDISWPATTSDRGAAVSAYRIKLKQTDGTMTEIAASCDGTQSGVVTSRACSVPMATLTSSPFSLAIGSLVVAQVEAQNAEGWADPSPANTAGALAETLPTAGPTATRGSDTTATQIEVAWTALSTSPDNGGSAITSYQLYWDSASGGLPATWTLAATVAAGGALTATASSLTTGQTYQFGVRAINVHGTGPLGPTLAVLAAGEPAAPTGLTASSATSTTITLSWTAPTDTGGVALTDYQVYWNEGNGGGTSTIYVALALTGGTTTTYTATGLSASSSYGFSVAAVNAAGTGPPTASLLASTTA